MTENKIIDVLKRILDEKVKVYIYTLGGHHGFGYIVEIGADFVRLRRDWKEDSGDVFLPIDSIDKVSTEWKEK